MRSLNCRIAVRTLFLLATFTLHGMAQQPAARGSWASIGQLAPGAVIRVTLAGGRMIRGFLQATTADSLSINATTSQEMLSRADVQRVQRKSPGHRGRNTLIGLGVGTVAGLTAGAGLDHENAGGFLPDAGKIVFTPIGMIIGTVVGVAWPTGRWHEVYRAP